jgi:tetratricopeptide (TPR) repeat protein
MNDSVIGRNYFFAGRFDLALEPLLTAYNLTPESGMNQFWKSLILFYNNRMDEACDFICESVKEPERDTWTQMTIFLKNVIRGDKDKLNLMMTPAFVKTHGSNPQNSFNIAAFYSLLDEKEKAFEWLENSVNHGFVNYPFINEYDPFLKIIRNEEHFKSLMKRVKQVWESIEV